MNGDNAINRLVYKIIWAYDECRGCLLHCRISRVMHDPELEPRLMRLRVNAPRNINPLITITIIL